VHSGNLSPDLSSIAVSSIFSEVWYWYKNTKAIYSNDFPELFLYKPKTKLYSSGQKSLRCVCVCVCKKCKAAVSYFSGTKNGCGRSFLHKILGWGAKKIMKPENVINGVCVQVIQINWVNYADEQINSAKYLSSGQWSRANNGTHIHTNMRNTSRLLDVLSQHMVIKWAVECLHKRKK
jgi:hypothetical protein